MIYTYQITQTINGIQKTERFEVSSMDELIACYRMQVESEHGVAWEPDVAGDAHLQTDLLK